ncbi:MAG: beta-galactosidase trimerization domain-containing protein, partial [Planctomycetota bacterium]
LFRILAENHILFDVIENAALAQGNTPKALEDYQLVILPDVRYLSDTVCSRLDAYVANGGKLLATGMTSTADENGNPLNAIRLKAAGVKPVYKLQPHTRGTYFRIRPEDKKQLAVSDLYALDIAYLDSDFLVCEPAGETESLLGFIPEAMYGPPEKCYYTKVTDIPGLLYSHFGQGRCAFFPWLIGSHYQRRSNHVQSLLVMGALEGLLGLDRSVVVEASPLVEVTRHADSDSRFEWVGLINHTGQNGTAFHKPIPMSAIPLQLKTQRNVKSIRLLRAEKKLDFSAVRAGWIKCVVPELQRFEIVLCEYE